MNLEQEDLISLKNRVLDYARGNFPELQVYAILLYGSASQYNFGLKDNFRDYDLNIFFVSDKQNRKASNYGKLKIIGEYKDKRIEVWKNIIIKNNKEFNEEVLRDYIKLKNSKRWKAMASQRLTLIYPYISEFKSKNDNSTRI